MSCEGCGNDEKSRLLKATQAIAMGALGVAKVILGYDPAPQEIIEQRRAICRACEFAAPGKINKDKKVYCGPLWDSLVHDSGTCGCLITAKSMVAAESCPKAKWGPVSPTVRGCAVHPAANNTPKE